MASLQVVCVTSVDDSKNETGKNKVESMCLMALSEVRKACSSVQANFDVVLLESLDFHGSSNFLHFYEADVAVVDMSSREHQSSLIYHIGIRESMGRQHTIITLFDSDPELTLSVKLSCCQADFISYNVDRSGKNLLAHFSGPSLNKQEECTGSLSQFVRRILKSVACKSKVHAKEKFLGELKKMRNTLKGEELSGALAQMKSQVYDPDLYSSEIILNMLLLYRDVQDYHAMVELVEDLEAVPSNQITHTVTIQHLYAFALNRRNNPGDRDKSLKCILKAIEMSGSEIPDLLCLCGRIYKDKYVESQLQDSEALNEAIRWYERAYEAQVNIYAGINLATLLVISGKDINTSPGLQKITRSLINLIGRKGSLKNLSDYWDVATFFEVCVLRQDFVRATQAAECMYKLDPPAWYLKSTLGNIQLINSSPNRVGKEAGVEIEVFEFWLDLFAEATKESTTDVRFPVLILEPNKMLQPSYLQTNEEGFDPSIRLWHVGVSNSKGLNEWLLTPHCIKTISKCLNNDKALFLYVYDNADDFHLFFPSSYHRNKVHDSIITMVINSSRDTDVLMEVDASLPVISYEYECDERGNRVVLGEGRFGTVYAGFNYETQVKIAIKEIPTINNDEVQALKEEVAVLCRLHHSNIVKYLGCESQNNSFKLFMERIPGGSLSSLLRDKWGPLIGNETTIVIYTLQIVKGLNYLHENGIVHRNLKGSNVLVNTYSGLLKISDYSISRRLKTLSLSYRKEEEVQDEDNETEIDESFHAPEVVQYGVRGYGFPADVWAVGCSVIEMATGEAPKRSSVQTLSCTPHIPNGLSYNAVSFLKNCFMLEARSRPSLALLLQHAFIHQSHKKKSPQVVSQQNKAQDINRSLSVPASSLIQKSKEPQRRKTQVMSLGQVEESPPTSIESPHDTFHPYKLPLANHRHFLSMDSGPRVRPNNDVFNFKNITSPVDSVFSSEMSLAVPDSAGVVEDNFYTLQKDSERKGTLAQVLSEDQNEICEKWLRMIKCRSNNSTSQRINTEILLILLEGINQFIYDNDLARMKNVIGHLEKEILFENKAKDELLLAVVIFPEIISAVLRAHNIEPHWIFSLDNIIKSTTKQIIPLLSSGLGACFRDDGDSGVNMDDESVSHGSFDKVKKFSQQKSTYQTDESNQLLRSLIRSELLSKEMITRNISFTKLHIQFIQEFMQNNTNFHKMLQQQTETPDSDVDESGEVHDWLQDLRVTRPSIIKILQHKFELRHLLHVVDRVDLQNLDLKMGDFYKVWEAIQNYRQECNNL